MKKVLIITYYWPPSGGSAVLRWLKFAKYLRDFGWEPVVYTPANPEPQEIDTSLLKDIPENMEVIKSPIREPYHIYKLLAGKKKEDRLGVALMSDKKQGLFSTVSLWIRSNLFIPDPRRFWVGPSVRLLSRYLQSHPVDVIVTTGPPHSMHLIGLGLKNSMGIKWVADFRDPWTNIDFYRDLALTRWADRCHKKLERKVLHDADQIITVSPGMSREFTALGVSRIATITNGFDVVPSTLTKHLPEKFTLLHLGSIPKSRNPENLWRVLADLVGQNPGFAEKLQIKLIGKKDRIVQESIERYALQDFVLSEDFIPHENTFHELTEAAVLLLFINNTPNAGGILTNKFFEYLSARRPILAIGQADGDASVILGETRAGKIFEYKDSTGLKNHLLDLFGLYSQNKLFTESGDIERFSRKSLAGKLGELLTQLIS
jgi:glycosyltransferase involved in cell wall biosynthesis